MKEGIVLSDILHAGMQVAGLWTIVSNPEVANKIIDTVSRGFSTLYEPKRIERILKKIGEDGSNISITNGEFSLKIEGRESQNIIDEVLIKSLVDKSINEIINVNKIIQETAKILKDKDEISEDKVDTDWATRYFNIVKDISNEEMKIIWSKLLADEINKPGSVSLRAIETMKNLSSYEAREFANVVKHSMHWGLDKLDNLFIINDRELLNRYNIKLDTIMLMKELNLIQSESLSMLLLPKHHHAMNNMNTYNGKLGIFIEVERDNRYLDIYKFTRLGKELSKIVELEDVDFYLEELLLSMKKRYPDIKMYTMERNLKGTFNGDSSVYINSDLAHY